MRLAASQLFKCPWTISCFCHLKVVETCVCFHRLHLPHLRFTEQSATTVSLATGLEGVSRKLIEFCLLGAGGFLGKLITQLLKFLAFV